MLSISFFFFAIVVTLDNIQGVDSFASEPVRHSLHAPVLNFNNPRVKRTTFQQATKSSYDPEEEVERRLAKAKEVLAKSKAKLEKSSQTTGDKKNGKTASSSSSSSGGAPAPLPFFASKKRVKDPRRRENVIKAKNEETGLVQADGEKMAAMSEKEEWEYRSLLEVFENAVEENGDVYSTTSQQLAERDVAASIWNLRKTMKTEDYLKIFDRKNRFIGEDN
jgi:hypothetical protein